MKLYLSLWRGLIPVQPRIHIGTAQPGAGTLRRVVIETAIDHGVSVEDITGGARDRAAVLARDDAAYRMRLLDASTTMIAKALGGRNHTTILVALKRQTMRLSGRTPLYSWTRPAGDEVAA